MGHTPRRASDVRIRILFYFARHVDPALAADPKEVRRSITQNPVDLSTQRQSDVKHHAKTRMLMQPDCCQVGLSLILFKPEKIRALFLRVCIMA